MSQLKNIKKYWWWIGLLIFILAVYYLLYLFRDSIDVEDASNIGNIMSPLLALIAAVLMYLAFAEQRKFNIRERFESKFYEMLHIHRQNVEEMKLGEFHGRQVFQEMYDEYKCISDITNAVFDNEDRAVINKLSYLLLYYGYQGYNAKKFINELFPDMEDKTKILLSNKINTTTNKNIGSTQSIYPDRFYGHYQLLAHYFTHLWYLVRLVDTEKSLSLEEKKDYMKIVRGQLSVYEQGLLWLNAHYYRGRKGWLPYIETLNENGKVIGGGKYNLCKNSGDLPI